MNQITDAPNEYTFGHDFNYAVWDANTVITLCNVPWNNDYRDIVKFDNEAALNTYIDAKGSANVTIADVSYAKVNRPVRLNIPFNRAYKYNYLRAVNPAQPISGDSARSFYYFILDVRYVAPMTTEVIVQLDVWQTFGYGVTFGRCFVERGHIGIANSKNFDNHGRDYLTTPEGLDVGSEYRTIDFKSETVMVPFDSNTSEETWHNVLVLSSVDLRADAGSVSSPNLVIATPSYYRAITTGVGAYVFKSALAFSSFVASMASKPWVLQGIISVTIIPSLKRYHPSAVYDTAPTPKYLHEVVYTNTGVTVNDSKYYDMYTNWRDALKLLIPARYRHLNKFLTFPYMIVEMTAWLGHTVVLKPEAWNDNNARIMERFNPIPPGQRITFVPQKYNTPFSYQYPNGDDAGDFLDSSLSIDNFPGIPVVNDQGILGLAASAHGMAFQYHQADWAQQKALLGNNQAFDLATQNISQNTSQMLHANNAARAMTDMNNQYNMQRSAISGLTGIGQGAVGGVVAGPAGAVAGAAGGAASGILGVVGAAMDGAHASTVQAMNAGSAAQSQRMANDHAAYVRDSNRDLADFAARGDYAMAIGAIQAKVQDARMTQPAVLGQFGGDIANILNYNSELSLRWKTIGANEMVMIGEYWLRYGYAINRFIIINSLQVMSKFTYWKMSETYISGADMPEPFKQTIRGIFEKGVTVWNNPADIGVADPGTNTALSGVSY